MSMPARDFAAAAAKTNHIILTIIHLIIPQLQHPVVMVTVEISRSVDR